MNPKCPHFATCDQFYCAEIRGIVVIGIWWFCLTICVHIWSQHFPLCVLHFWVWSFVWTLILSFFFCCSLSGVFLLFIYLFFKHLSAGKQCIQWGGDSEVDGSTKWVYRNVCYNCKWSSRHCPDTRGRKSMFVLSALIWWSDCC